jgi:hypothetical protein
MVVFALALFVIGTVPFGLEMYAERGIVSRLDNFRKLLLFLFPIGNLVPEYLKLSKQSFNLTLVLSSLLFLR